MKQWYVVSTVLPAAFLNFFFFFGGGGERDIFGEGKSRLVGAPAHRSRKPGYKRKERHLSLPNHVGWLEDPFIYMKENCLLHFG